MSFEHVRPVRIVGGPVSYYEDYHCTNLYVERLFGGNAKSITITNDSATDTAQLSFDGATIEADVKPGESLTINTGGMTSVRVKATAGGDHVRIWAW